jgi:hypothetical protein
MRMLCHVGCDVNITVNEIRKIREKAGTSYYTSICLESLDMSLSTRLKSFNVHEESWTLTQQYSDISQKPVKTSKLRTTAESRQAVPTIVNVTC